MAGRYADLLRTSLEERNRAAIEGRPDLEAVASVGAARACARIGRSAEVLSHAARAAELAPSAGMPDLPALARQAHAGGLRCARRYDEALAALKEALDALPDGHDALRAEILLDTAETALEAGSRRDAEAALGRGGALVQYLRDPLLLAWSLYLRSRLEDDASADLQLAAAYEIAKKAGCPELQWQILWRLSERAQARGSTQMRDDLAWNAHGLLSKLAETLEPDDATAFWRQGPRRTFLDQVQRRCGPSFLKMVMLGGAAGPDPSDVLVKGFGFDPASVSAFLAQLS